MDDADWLAARFEESRPHLRLVAYRMLGSLPEADDAVQNSWLRLSGANAGELENLTGWLTTVVARECLKALRARRRRREEPIDDALVMTAAGADDPEAEALLADSVGRALMVVLGTLAPAERVAFVLHDIFALPFDEIALIVERSPVTRSGTRARPVSSGPRWWTARLDSRSSCWGGSSARSVSRSARRRSSRSR